MTSHAPKQGSLHSVYRGVGKQAVCDQRSIDAIHAFVQHLAPHRSCAVRRVDSRVEQIQSGKLVTEIRVDLLFKLKRLRLHQVSDASQSLDWKPKVLKVVEDAGRSAFQRPP